MISSCLSVDYATHLSFVVCTIRWILQSPSQSTFRIAASEQLFDLTGESLHIVGSDRLDVRSEGAEVEVGRALGVQQVDVDCPPVYLGHCVG